MLQRIYSPVAALLIASAFLGPAPGRAAAQEQIVIDTQAQTTPFPHFWEQMFGSGARS